MIGILATRADGSAAYLPITTAAAPQISTGGNSTLAPGATVQPLDLAQEQPPNEYNAEILREMALTRTANRSTAGKWNNGSAGGSTATFTGPGGTAGAAGSPSPWLDMPINGRPFHFQKAVNCPAPGSNDFTVVSFVVPNGYNAALWGISNLFTAAGFDEGSGDLIWRIAVDGAYAPGFDSIQTTLGNISDSRKLQGPIIAEGNQLVSYTVSVSAGAPFPTGAAAKVICTFDGWIYPQV